MASTLKNLEVATEMLILDILSLVTFMLAGKASITIHNTATGTRYTFRFYVAKKRTRRGGYKAAHGEGPWDVQVRTGRGWMDLGHLTRDKQTGRLIHHHKARRFSYQGLLPASSPEAKALGYLLACITHNKMWSERVQVWRSDDCGRCGAALTTEYRHIGYGPVCCKHLGIDAKAIFKTLATLGEAPINARISKVREMVYADLTRADKTALGLLPGVAGDYARAHLQAA